MTVTALDPRDIDALRTSSVPTLANAIETFEVRPPTAGYNRRPITCHWPALGMLVATAVTVTASTARPPGDAPPPIDEPAYWKWLEGTAGPKVVVVRDEDDPPGGAMWGEWNANVHLALGCVGTITDGAVRDLDALERLRFHTFATSVSVAHGYGAFTGYGDPVDVAGLTVETGDVLVADRHGVLSLPAEIPVAALVEAARTIDALESEVFAFCQADRFTVDGLATLERSVLDRWPGVAGTVR
jgi:regulator of RNase E activity RraA